MAMSLKADPLVRLTKMLRAVEDCLADMSDFRDDPNLPEYLELLQRKRREFRARIQWLVQRN
jgi:hypothetical protein